MIDHKNDFSPAQIEYLQTPIAEELMQQMFEETNLAKRLKILRKKLTSDQSALLSHQVELKRRGMSKFQQAQKMLFCPEGLEQASAEIVASHVARRFKNKTPIVDLTCGIGGDAIALATCGEIIACDIDKSRLMLCRHNLKVHGHQAQLLQNDARQNIPEGRSYFIDPARRVAGLHVSQLSQSQPPISAIDKALQASNSVAIKASPALDHRQLPWPCELEVISVGSECREIVLWLGDMGKKQTTATLLPAGISFVGNHEHAAPVGEIGAYIYEVNAAIFRAHLLQDLAHHLNLWRIDEQLSYLTSDEKITSPWLKPYKVLKILPFSEKRLKKELRLGDFGRIRVKCRSFVGTEQGWQKRFKSKGKHRAFVFLCRIHQKPIAMICQSCTQ